MEMIASLTVLALATHRLWFFWTTQEIFRPLREWIINTFPESKLAYLVACPICVSMWAAMVVVGLWFASPYSALLVWALAASNGLVVVNLALQLLERKMISYALPQR